MDPVKIGFAPTRRNLFSSEAAIEYANLTREKMILKKSMKKGYCMMMKELKKLLKSLIVKG